MGEGRGPEMGQWGERGGGGVEGSVEGISQSSTVQWDGCF